METNPIIGVMQTEKSDGTESLLLDFARALQQNGWNVGGLVQQTTRVASGSPHMELLDLRTGDRYVISQPLGQKSGSCCLDTTGLCDSSAVLRREIEAGVDLLIINKFAVAEAEGKGLLQELFLAVQSGVPVLTSVASRYQEDWDRLTGGCGQAIKPSTDALTAWWGAVSAARQAHGSAH